MAICTHRLLGLVGIGDPGRVRRVAVRFASPTPVGADLTVDAYGINEQSFAFEAACGRCGRHHPGKVGAAAMAGLDIGVYVPQMGFSYRDVLHRAQRCEELSIGRRCSARGTSTPGQAWNGEPSPSGRDAWPRRWRSWSGLRADERIDFAGKHYTVRDMPIVPGPVQRPRPPITVGGVGEKVHAAAGGALRRRLERARLRARRA